MSQQILLISYAESELYNLHYQVQSALPNYVIKTAVNMRQGFSGISNQQIPMIIMNFDLLNDVVAKHVRTMKTVVDQVPLLVLGRVKQASVLEEMALINQTVVLDKPFETRDLNGLMQKMLQESAIAQRVHRRYPTQQSAYLEVYGRDVESETTLLNLSKGGAYLEAPKAKDIKVGDLLRLNVDLNQARRNYCLHAKVVWTAPGANAQRSGFGVAFLNTDQMYREMQGR